MADGFFIEIVFRKVVLPGEEFELVFINEIEQEPFLVAVRAIAHEDFFQAGLYLIAHRAAMTPACIRSHCNTVPDNSALRISSWWWCILSELLVASAAL